MIIVPRVLAELLRAADDELQKSLALDFAQHAVQECRDGIDSYEVYNSYLAAARAFLGGQGSIDQLEEHRKEFHAYWQRSDLSGAVGTPVQLAVLMVCWHDLKATRTVILSKKPPSLIDIAR
ncbi:MAG: hypothetical protein J2P17_21150, partial [Mycobacterium sp.]|nr:hypothetical protein [Mycobacterium sp.]